MSETTTKKRKQPPSFRHLPENRAKKLKRTWVENQKIKSQWKAQKRREGLSTALKAEDEHLSGNHEDAPDPEAVAATEHTQLRSPSEREGRELESDDLHHRSSELKHRKQQTLADNEATLPPPSLRELTRKAYSRSSLHTFKANTSRRRNNERSGGGDTKAGGSLRGQPNMKLRMEAMLEKIKRTMD